jgi:hypothetical protein
VVADQRGQALLLLLGGLCAVLVGGLVLAAIAAGVSGRAERQRAADLAALSAARAMRAVQHRVYAPALIGGRPNPVHLSPAAYRAIAQRAAGATGARNGACDLAVAFPGGGLAPVRVRVVVRDPVTAGLGAILRGEVAAEAELVPPGSFAAGGGAGAYTGPLAMRQGKPSRTLGSGSSGKPPNRSRGRGTWTPSRRH